MKVYLAGPIFGSSDSEVHGWRNDLIRRLPRFDFVNPADRDYRGLEAGNESRIVSADKADIDGCDLVVARCRASSWGTAMEILYAYERNIPVIVWADQGPVSPWLVHHASTIRFYAAEVAGVVYGESVRAGSH